MIQNQMMAQEKARKRALPPDTIRCLRDLSDAGPMTHKKGKIHGGGAVFNTSECLGDKYLI